MSHPRVKVAQLASVAITVGDLHVLVRTGVHHHVPGIAIQPICPIVIALRRQSRENQFSGFPANHTLIKEGLQNQPHSFPTAVTSATFQANPQAIRTWVRKWE